ncbi:MAG TPA: TetR/AcrR family transcriptional regulator [Acidimicrobiales bacterium]|nr:TetR/AcrR family transcriptional regulator [Acidimicrobiales bacterium]
MLGEPVRDRRAERHEATKVEILEAAWDLCRTEGLAGLSLRDLARRVGMQAPSLYSYFDSKHDIYDAMFAQGSRDFVAGQRHVALSGDTLTDLKVRLRYFVDFCTSDEVRYQLMFQRTIPGFEPSPASFAVSLENLQEMATWFAEVGLGGQESLDLFTAIATGLVDQQISNDPGGDRWLRLVDDAMEMFCDHVQRRAATSKSRTKSKPKATNRKVT